MEPSDRDDRQKGFEKPARLKVKFPLWRVTQYDLSELSDSTALSWVYTVEMAANKMRKTDT